MGLLDAYIPSNDGIAYRHHGIGYTAYAYPMGVLGSYPELPSKGVIHSLDTPF
jgi:hypothetical protein